MNPQSDLIVHVELGIAGWQWRIQDFQNKRPMATSGPGTTYRAPCLRSLKRVTGFEPPNKQIKGNLKWRTRRP